MRIAVTGHLGTIGKPLVNPVDLAWAAGFLDGEGTFGVNHGRYPRITCPQKERELLDRLHRLFGGTIHRRRTGGSLYVWSLDGEVVREVMMALRPQMSERRQAQIDEALRRERRTPENRGSRNRQKNRCPKGHPYDSHSNSIEKLKSSSGLRTRRWCSVCRNERRRERYRSDPVYQMQAINKSREYRRDQRGVSCG